MVMRGQLLRHKTTHPTALLSHIVGALAARIACSRAAFTTSMGDLLCTPRCLRSLQHASDAADGLVCDAAWHN